MSHMYDFVIVGSGLGGMVTGLLLARNGYDVCIVEQNRQYGGNLQNFSRDKRIFDTGVHYVGGLDPGQNTYQYFKYLGVLDDLRLQQLDVDGFDLLTFGQETKPYRYAQGYERLIELWSEDFPGEQAAIRKYCEAIQYVCAHFPMYNLRTEGGTPLHEQPFLTWGARDYINSLTTNQRLRDVFGGSNMLYAGDAEQTPFYVHALVVNSYVESAYRLVGGSSQITKAVTRQLRAQGATLRNYARVESFVFTGDELTGIRLADGEVIAGKQFISNISPHRTLDLLGEGRIRSSYAKRIRGLSSTPGAFSLYLSLKPGWLPYPKYNHYHTDEQDIWRLHEHNDESWPKGYGVFAPAEKPDQQYSTALSILTYMHMHEVAQWADTHRTDFEPADRGQSYEDFKQRKADKLLNLVERRYPGLRDNTISMYTSTPVSYRDYIGIQEGSMYGYAKDVRNPLTSMVSHRTKIPNLYLTGQNIHMHGVLGVTVGAFITCSEFLDIPAILAAVRNA